MTEKAPGLKAEAGDLLAAWADAFARRDPAAVAGCYAGDGSLEFCERSKIAWGRPAIEELIAVEIEGAADPRIEWGEAIAEGDLIAAEYRLTGVVNPVEGLAFMRVKYMGIDSDRRYPRGSVPPPEPA